MIIIILQRDQRRRKKRKLHDRRVVRQVFTNDFFFILFRFFVTHVNRTRRNPTERTLHRPSDETNKSYTDD